MDRNLQDILTKTSSARQLLKWIYLYEDTFEMSIQIKLDCKYNVATRFLTMQLLLIIRKAAA